MSSATSTLEEFASREYQHGFVTDIDAETLPPGLDENVIRLISSKKNEPEFLLEWRLKAYRHWTKMTEPKWPNVHYRPIDFKKIIYYAAPKPKKQLILHKSFTWRPLRTLLHGSRSRRTQGA